MNGGARRDEGEAAIGRLASSGADIAEIAAAPLFVS